MKRIVLACAAVLLLATVFLPGKASANYAGPALAISEIGKQADVQTVGWHWRHRHWRRHHHWYRPYWRHRHWRRYHWRHHYWRRHHWHRHWRRW